MMNSSYLIPVYLPRHPLSGKLSSIDFCNGVIYLKLDRRYLEPFILILPRLLLFLFLYNKAHLGWNNVGTIRAIFVVHTSPIQLDSYHSSLYCSRCNIFLDPYVLTETPFLRTRFTYWLVMEWYRRWFKIFKDVSRREARLLPKIK